MGKKVRKHHGCTHLVLTPARPVKSLVEPSLAQIMLAIMLMPLQSVLARAPKSR